MDGRAAVEGDGVGGAEGVGDLGRVERVHHGGRGKQRGPVDVVGQSGDVGVSGTGRGEGLGAVSSAQVPDVVAVGVVLGGVDLPGAGAVGGGVDLLAVDVEVVQ